MSEHNHRRPVWQIPVAVTIDNEDGSPTVRYTYFDPADDHIVIRSKTCVLATNEPYYGHFAIDFPTSHKGWIFLGLYPKPDNPLPENTTSPNRLSMSVLNDGNYKNPTTYAFNLIFYNLETHVTVINDPQEGNTRQPPF